VLENLSNRAVAARFQGDLAVAAEDNRVLRAPSPVIVPARDAAGAARAVRVFLQADFTAKELAELRGPRAGPAAAVPGGRDDQRARRPGQRNHRRGI
jgi:hypothetical protein